jgi:LysM repeat protein
MWRKRGRSLLGLSVVWMVILGGGLSAGEMDQGSYTVRRGDTLWHIAGTFLQDPRLWPKIWEKNRYIKNPNLIFPGDPITIPGKGEGPVAKEAATAPEGEAVTGELATTPEVVEGVTAKPSEVAPPATAGEKEGEKERKEEEAEVKTPTSELPPSLTPPVVTQQTVADSGFIGRDEILRERKRITDSVEVRPKQVSWSPTSKELGIGDEVIINVGSLDNVMVGDRFSILRPTRRVYHPVSGKRLGILVLNIGWLETKEVMDRCSKAEIAYCYMPADLGDRLGPYEVPAFPVDLNAEPTNLEARGCIVASRDPKETLGARDIVYVDLGLKQNIGPGDMFFISRPIALPRGSGPCKPRTRVGELVVLRAGEETSSAFILESNGAVVRGDQVFLDKKMP